MKILRFFTFILCSVSASALTAQSLIPYQYSLGSTGNNSVGKPIIDNEGNYYLFIDVSMFSSAHTTGNLGTFQYGSNFFVVSKHKSDHELIWRKAFGGDSSDYFGGATLVNDGVIISSLSNSTDTGTKTVESNGFFHIWLQKIDFNGNEIWQTGIFT